MEGSLQQQIEASKHWLWEERKPGARSGIQACSSTHSSSGSGICSLLALPGQAMAQVSDTWGPESHARKLYTLGPQVTAASSRSKQTGLPKEEVGLQSPLAGGLLPGRKVTAQERTLPPTRVRGRKEKGERREDEQGHEHRAGEGRGWVLPEKGADEGRRWDHEDLLPA